MKQRELIDHCTNFTNMCYVCPYDAECNIYVSMYGTTPACEERRHPERYTDEDIIDAKKRTDKTMITVEGAIAQCNKNADYCKRHGMNKAREECKQIAGLLRELQERRKAPEIVRCGECKQKSFCPSKIDCGNGLDYIIDFCSNGKRAERRNDE